MQWYKHMSNMIDDMRIRRIIDKHGALGYAVYTLILERITRNLTTDSSTPDLEEGAEDIALLLKADTVKVNEIMLDCMSAGLFSQDEITGRLICHKIYKFIVTRR